ncbi:glycosyltransferase family 4 protein [Pseudorhodobacter ferrugineus]|uniref:glycosyltransferase family 4 protein n=1 Tax=Pseudorhodobacter ferrugineus TaxID=77008 RepID=UPI0003B5E7E0|nr:glycosyltransferase [Pseudorhodobacter ferrugineus]
MTVLHIITGLHDGGAEAVLFRLCTQDQAYQHHVASLRDAGKYGPLLEAQGVRVTCLSMPRGRVTVSGLWRLWCLIRKERPAVIQTWMYHADLVGGVIARLAGHRNIVWGIRHTTLVPGQSPRTTIWVAKVCARLSRIVPRRIVCCAEKAREVHAKLGYDRDRMQVIPNGYDLSVFQPNPSAGQQVRHALSLDKAEDVIGFVARYDPQKDHDNLLRALAILNGQGICPQCLLVGTGLVARNTILVERISELGLQDLVHLIGCRNDVPALMNALDLHVMSSAFGEAFPNVLAEAMACGTPCVSTDVGDAAEIVGPTGRIVPPRNPEALAKAIRTMLAEKVGPDWTVRREDARRRVSERYSLSQMVDSYHEVWVGHGQHGMDRKSNDEDVK